MNGTFASPRITVFGVTLNDDGRYKVSESRQEPAVNAALAGVTGSAALIMWQDLQRLIPILREG
eukprot:CAMPEP_0204549746 /NCGR_PEP_ID=MMETSP0661-20131031/24578_1 /ASSEMBLY_ACC=CAM_ASM_000606 /TAXON_ID=109239 /ORGANISM="Alexandrium margalefi, Strain AMGDE01CS-322" /LENGTH=63 /DNA_ID=CAMNT_0051556695 /DNA_START=159 /DNA_END=347 /DNA_ORIENTATION=-